MDTNSSPRRPAAAVLTALAPWIVLLVCAVAPFVVAAMEGAAPWFGDISDHWHPHRLVAHQARQTGETAHWYAGLFCGMPLTGQPDGGGLLYPVHWITDRFDPAHTLLPQIVLHRFWLGVLGFLLARVAGMGRLGATLTGALLVFAGTTTVSQQQPAHLRTVAWLPALPLGTLLVLRGRQLLGTAVLAAGGAVAFLAGYPAFVVIVGFTVPLLWATHPVAGPPSHRWTRAGPLLPAAAVLAGCLAAAQLLTTSALVPTTQRSVGLTPEFVDAFRAAPADLLMILSPRFGVDGGVVRSGFGHLGVGAFVLGVVALLRRPRGAVAFGCIALAGLVLALGRGTPIGRVVWSLPGLEFFRNPSQYLHLWCLGGAVLAGLGLMTTRARPLSRIESVVAPGAAIALLGLGMVWNGAPTNGAEWARLAIAGTAAVGVVGLLRFAPGRLGPALVVGLCLLEAGSLGFGYAGRADRTRPVAEILAGEPSAVRVAEHHASTGRVQPPRGVTSDRFFNWDNRVTTAGVDNVRGLSSLVPYRTMDVSRIIEVGEPFPREPLDKPLYDYGPLRALDSPLLDLLALRYALGFREAPAESGWTRIGPQEWEREAVDPVRFVPNVIEVDPESDGWRHFVVPGFDPITTAVVETPAALELDGVGTVQSYERGPNHTRLEVTSTGRSLLLRTVTHAAGWTATIDDAPVTLLRANHAFQAIVVPAGSHEVVFRYEPPRWRLGLAISGVGFLLWLGLCVLAWREHVRLREGASTVGAAGSEGGST